MTFWFIPHMVCSKRLIVRLLSKVTLVTHKELRSWRIGYTPVKKKSIKKCVSRLSEERVKPRLGRGIKFFRTFERFDKRNPQKRHLKALKCHKSLLFHNHQIKED